MILARPEFEGKRVIIHRDGEFRKDERNNIQSIGQKINATFVPVEIIKRNSPRLFAKKDGKWQNPSAGTFLQVSEREAILCNSRITGTRSVQPLRIRCYATKELYPNLVAIVSLRLTHFSSTAMTKLPITILYSDQIANLFRKGIDPPSTEGTVQWWI